LDGEKWNDKGILAQAPYDWIHVGFSFQPANDFNLVSWFSSLLKDSNSRMLAGWGTELCLFDYKGFRQDVANIPGMAEIQKGRFIKQQSRSERLDIVKAALDDWKARFGRERGKKPSKDDLFADPEAVALFKEYSSLSKLT